MTDSYFLLQKEAPGLEGLSPLGIEVGSCYPHLRFSNIPQFICNNPGRKYPAIRRVDIQTVDEVSE
jgi:hypothetical protein